ncbi:MAG TPA: acyltransferase family protein, partial [Ktedonobacterales bacterium]
FPQGWLLYTNLDSWGISLIFLLAGASSKFALETQSAGAYVKARVLRLLAPMLLVAICFTPIDSYFLLLVNPKLISVSPRPIADPERLRDFGAFMLQYWAILFTTGLPIVVRNVLAHLWFVPRLLVVSLVCLPLLLALRERWPRWMARVAASRLPLELLVVGAGLLPAALMMWLQLGWLNQLTTGWPLRDDWTQFFLDLVMFVFGYLLYSHLPLLAVVRRLAYVALGLAGLTWASLLIIRWNRLGPANHLSASYVVFALAQGLAIWLLTLGVLGTALRLLTMAPAWQRYLVVATFPVYVLHLPILFAAAYYLQSLTLTWPFTWALITVVTFGGAFALYEYVVRRTPVTRLAFGLEGAPAVAAPAKTYG